jgi:hypothetical protein
MFLFIALLLFVLITSGPKKVTLIQWLNSFHYGLETKSQGKVVE